MCGGDARAVAVGVRRGVCVPPWNHIERTQYGTHRPLSRRAAASASLEEAEPCRWVGREMDAWTDGLVCMRMTGSFVSDQFRRVDGLRGV